MTISDGMFDLGRRKGVIDFATYLRGKVDPDILMESYEAFIALNPLPEIVEHVCE